MKRHERVGLLLIVLLACPAVARAYVDPGAGSMLLQFLLGGVAGILFFLKLVKASLLGRLGIGRKEDKK